MVIGLYIVLGGKRKIWLILYVIYMVVFKEIFILDLCFLLFLVILILKLNSYDEGEGWWCILFFFIVNYMCMSILDENYNCRY